MSVPLRSLALAAILLIRLPAGVSIQQRAVQQTNLATIHMVTPLVGWGTNQQDVLHTVDGARHWQIVTPSIPWAKGYSTDYLPLDVVDGRTAWLGAPNRLGTRPATSVYLFHSVDAGHHWTRLPPLRLGRFGGIAQLQFVDSVHGWIVVIRGAGMSQISFDLYRTTDGGRRWQRILEEEDVSGNHHHIGGGLPELDLGQSFTYQNPSSGWVAGCFCGFGSIPELFFHSTNGGHTWRPYHLHLPPAYQPGNASVSAPEFFSRQIAVLPVYLLPHRPGHRRFDAYHTSDGGRTWHGTTAIPVRADRYYEGFVDPRHGFVLDNRGLRRTDDGGYTWQRTAFSFSRLDLITVGFVTPAVAFTLEGIGASTRSRLYESTNAGRTWRLAPSIVSR